MAQIGPDRSVLLTGATAQVGLHLLPLLHSAGFDTTALSRKIKPEGTATEVPVKSVHWKNPVQLRASIEAGNADDRSHAGPSLLQPGLLVSAGPIALALEWLERCPSIRRVVCLSTTSVLSKADSSDAAEREQIAGIIRAEAGLMTACKARQIDLCLLRPTLIYGCGMDENISRLASLVQRFGFLPLAGKACGLRQPVHVADLAALMFGACQSGWSGQHAWAVAGGSTLTYREMVVKIFQALGRTPRLASLPEGLLAHLVDLAGRFSQKKGLNAAMVRRQNQDLVFDDSEVRQRFGFQPRAFEPVPEDFRLPNAMTELLPPVCLPEPVR